MIVKALTRFAFQLWVGAKQEWAAAQVDHDKAENDKATAQLSAAEVEMRAIEQAFIDRKRGNLRAAAAGVHLEMTRRREERRLNGGDNE